MNVDDTTGLFSEPPAKPDAPAPDPASLDGGSSVDRYTVFQQRRRGVKVAGFGLLLPATAIYEIAEAVNISPMPGVTGLFKGFVNHRGNVAPVYDLNELTGEDEATWERKRLLILNSGTEAVAVKLYELPVPVRDEYGVPDSFLDSVPEIFQRHLRQAYKTTERLWLDIDMDAFFDALSRRCLKTNEHENTSLE